MECTHAPHPPTGPEGRLSLEAVELRGVTGEPHRSPVKNTHSGLVFAVDRCSIWFESVDGAQACIGSCDGTRHLGS